MEEKHEHELIRTPEDNAVCTKCGLVVDAGLCDYSAEVPEGFARPKAEYLLGATKRVWGTYRAIFHLNERLAQLCLAEPTIPAELWELIEMEFDFGDFERTYPKAPELTKADIAKICGSITVPDDLQEKFRSKKFKQNPLKNMKRYTEKWLTIRKKLGAERPPPLHPNDVLALQTDFVALLKPFNIYRHTDQCKGGPKCHLSSSKCRHNLPNYNYLMLQLLRRRGKAAIYKKYLPQLRTGGKVKNLDNLCAKMWNWLNWDFTPMFQRKKRISKTVCKSKPKKKIIKKGLRVVRGAVEKLRRSPRLARKQNILK